MIMRLFCLCVLVLMLACGGGGGDDSGDNGTTGGGPDFSLGNCKVPRDQFQDGGPGPDGIPAILDPVISPMTDTDPAALPLGDSLALVVQIGNEVRAYPEMILWNHEIINDTLGGRDIAVSYCPLTGSTVVFDRAPNEHFLVSGMLYETNLIMFDTATQSLWPQMELEASCGDRRDEDMVIHPVKEMTVPMLRKLYPGIDMVVDATRVDFSYGGYPYGSYDRVGNNNLLFPVSEVDPTLPLKSLVLVLRIGDEERGYPHLNFGGDGLVNDSFEGEDVVVFHIEEARFANSYNRKVGDQTLSFALIPAATADDLPMLRDNETNTLWNLKGEGVEGPLAGEQLTQMINFNVMWFSYRVSFPFAGTFEPAGKRGTVLYE